MRIKGFMTIDSLPQDEADTDRTLTWSPGQGPLLYVGTFGTSQISLNPKIFTEHLPCT